MLELSDEDNFKEAIIKMCEPVITNTLKTKGKRIIAKK